MATQWFCRLMGAELGPFSAREMVELVQHRRLTPEDLIRKGSEGDWVPAYLVQGLFDAAAQAPSAAADSPGSAGKPNVPAKGGAPNGASANRSSSTGKNAKGALHPTHATDSPGPKSLSGLLSALLLGNRPKSEAASPPAKSEPIVVARRASVESNPPVATTPAETRQDKTPPEERRWFCIVGGERRGPMSFEALKRIAATGKLKREDRVWSTSCPRWSRATDIPELTFQQ